MSKQNLLRSNKNDQTSNINGGVFFRFLEFLLGIILSDFRDANVDVVDRNLTFAVKLLWSDQCLRNKKCHSSCHLAKLGKS